MANIKRFLTVLLLFSSSLTFAGYAQLKPPPGWSAGMGAAIPGTPGTFNFGAAANGSTFKGSTVLTNASLNVGGQAIVVPVSMRLAANAASIAATYSFGNPLLFAALAAGSVAYDYFNANNLKVAGGVWVKTDGQVCSVAPCIQYRVDSVEAWFSNRQQACNSFAIQITGNSSAVGTLSGASQQFCDAPGGFSRYVFERQVPPVTQPQNFTPITESDFHQIMSPTVVPSGLPSALPGLSFPYEQPVINPDPASIPSTSPSPSSPPVPRPLFIPTGNPVPTSDPNVFNQPGLHVTPAPTLDSPWRIDVQPKIIPQSSPTPKTFEQLNPNDSPLTGQPNPTPGLCDLYPGILACTPTATIQDKLDFCKSNPDVAACQKLDNVQSDDLQTKNISSLITPDSGWGSSNASCPAARKLSIPGAEFSFQMICDFSSGIRPIILALAWLSAAFILLGMRGSE